jgi:hypothetical protein
MSQTQSSRSPLIQHARSTYCGKGTYENYESTLIREHSVFSNLNRRIKTSEDDNGRIHRDLAAVLQRVSTLEELKSHPPVEQPTSDPPPGAYALPTADTGTKACIDLVERKVKKLTSGLQETRLFANGLHTLVLQLQGSVVALQASQSQSISPAVRSRSTQRGHKRSVPATRPTSTKKPKKSSLPATEAPVPSAQGEEGEALDVMASPNCDRLKQSSGSSSSSSSSSSSEEGGYATDLVPLN